MANYIIIGGDSKEYGPVSEADVRQWISEGRLNGQSRVKAESDAEFRMLALFPEFAAALQEQQGAAKIVPPTISGTGNDNWEAEVLARDPKLNFSECLGAGWSFLGANAGFLTAAVLLTWVTNLLFAMLAVVVPLFGPLALLCFNGVIMGGFYLACLRRLRGEEVSPTEVFSGFKVAFGPLVLTGLVSGLLAELSACCFLLPAIYLFIAWSFAVPLVADKRMFFWSAMELSRKVVTRVWFEVFVLLIITFLPLLVFQGFGLFQMIKFSMGLWDQSGHNMQQLTQLLQSQNSDLKSLTIRSAVIGQGIFLVNLFYCAGVIVRAYENLFGTGKR